MDFSRVPFLEQSCPGDRDFLKPVRFAAEQKPHRPGIAPALGLRAGGYVSLP
jgi:hypothetical protein